MYINRIIDKFLIEWKESENRKPLLLRGARQVGKSCAIRNLGIQFEYFLEVNFEKRPDTKTLFESNTDVRTITKQLGLLWGVNVEPGKTLLFLDEIQSCPEALKSLWFFKEDFPELHVIAAGSLLEFTLKEMPSYGVGRIKSLFMYPFSFNEFLCAIGKNNWVDAIREASAESPLFDAIHNELITQYRNFLIIGGMPASVAMWVKKHDYKLCQSELDDIQTSYYDDFAKYSKKISPQLLRNTLLSVVAQNGKKFVYNKVEGGYRTEEIKKALNMLSDAGIIKRVNHTAANGLPLGAEINDKFRKYLYLDSGLLLRILDLDLGGANELTELIVTGSVADLVNKGGLAELFLGWEMLKHSNPASSHDLFYWENIKDGACSEVDYIIGKNFKVLPIECKAGTSGKMKSLHLFMKDKHLTEAIRCSLENFNEIKNGERTIKIIPLYAASKIM